MIRLQRHLTGLRQRSHHYTWLRLVLFGGGLLGSGLLFYFFGGWLFGLGTIITLLPFGIAVYYHRQLDRSIARHEGWRQLKSSQIARMQLDWERLPLETWRRPNYEHPFEADLDLVGEESLHRLLDTAVSAQGGQLLWEWLTAPIPDFEQIRERQQRVQELIPLSLFRGKLILNGTLAAGSRKMWNTERLLAWLEEPAPISWLRTGVLLSSFFIGFNLLLLFLNSQGYLPAHWPITSFALYFFLLWSVSGRLQAIFGEAMMLQEALQQLTAIFRQLETFSYRHTPNLKRLCAPFLVRTQRPSTHLAYLNRAILAVGLRGNPIVWLLLNAVFPWDFYFALRLSRYKQHMATHAPAWLECWFELEALSSLANLAYLNPDYTLPHLEDPPPSPLGGGRTAAQPVFQAQAIGHPLIPDAEKVCNDFTLTNLGEVMIITGSNMAGKSTFLRTIGVNLALAYAGGPVNAHHLHTRLFRLFTCIKVSDSVTHGISYFYAEVKRLKALLLALEADHPLPLFFFVDEIFRGTNNRERFIGSRAYLQRLVGQRGVGLVSTHDLELARLADQNPQLKNYHFRDEVAGDRMIFSYTLHPGPCPTTNALKIMELEGLPVESS
jgi:hypothetical protein